MNRWPNFHGPNEGYVLELYEKYQQNPNLVDGPTRALFEQWGPPAGATPPIAPPPPDLSKAMALVRLADAIREYGHLAATLDPLGYAPPPGDPALELSHYGLSEADLEQLPAGTIGGPLAQQAQNAAQAIAQLRQLYTATIGYDFEHIRVPAEREWLRLAVESGRYRPPQWPINHLALLERLTQVEQFEHFLQRFFPSKTRFSIEGLDMMVPILDEIIQQADQAEIAQAILGMAHRGRLNVLAHVLKKPYQQILAEFKDPGWNFTRRDMGWGWSGDVKYHAGQAREVREVGEPLFITLAPNPSHLEHVNPVVAGMARAAGSGASRPGAIQFNPACVLAITIHGDAAFPGQGIVAETLNMYYLPGYQVGGMIHIIANNQLGYTAEPSESRSTLYASDLAKGYKLPIVHVNADDPQACIEVARLAFAYRAAFGKDFVIDLVGYRRYGHNEGDEPTFTQPVLYERVKNQPTVGQQLAGRLVTANLIPPTRPEQLAQAVSQQLQAVMANLQPERDFPQPQLEPPPAGLAKRVETAVPAGQLQALNQALLAIPADFTPHPKLERGLRRRLTALDNPDEATIDWGMAEELALATILSEGIAIRFTGEDVERGTFSHRHAVWRDLRSGRKHTPLHTIPQAQAAFDIHNSPLSENGAIGFEYGYSVMKPEQLVIWEGQYGDFINGAQAIIDEFVVSGRAKWEQTPSLVLLLPHGYEGQGPDHSSGRLERFLQLAGETNMRIANPSTAGQYFHLLRRQARLLRTDPLPLVVMTPKSLLRHPLAAASLRDLSEGRWQRIIDDPQAAPEQVRRLILCSGKVYVDLRGHAPEPTIAIARLEQLYPFPFEDIRPVLSRYPQLQEIVWVQEEPANMGAWEAIRPWLEEVVSGRWPVRYLGRPRRASPAEGSLAWHKATQEALVAKAYQWD